MIAFIALRQEGTGRRQPSQHRLPWSPSVRWATVSTRGGLRRHGVGAVEVPTISALRRPLPLAATDPAMAQNVAFATTREYHWLRWQLDGPECGPRPVLDRVDFLRVDGLCRCASLLRSFQAPHAFHTVAAFQATAVTAILHPGGAMPCAGLSAGWRCLEAGRGIHGRRRLRSHGRPRGPPAA